MYISISLALLLIATVANGLVAQSNIPTYGDEGVSNQYDVPNKEVPSNNRPGFCTVYECPKFMTLCKDIDYEVRSYEPITWAYSDVQSSGKIMAINTAFRRIFRYISGENEKNITIPMSVPVVIKETLPSSLTYRVFFYLQDAYSTDPPKPLNSEVKILKDPGKTYFVYTYTGYVWAIYFNNKKYEKLKEILTNKGLIMTPKEYFVAGYDGPTKFFNRHNEIWIEADSNDVARIC